MALDLRSSELEHSFIKERINSAEKHILDINSKISAYVKKIAHVRDSGDDLAKCILHFASAENLNHTLRTALGQFSDILSSIQEYRDTEIQRTEMKVIFELSNYSSICKQAKKDLKESFEARAKELSKKNHLEKTRGRNPSNWQKIAQVCVCDVI
ncbi:Protein FAM92A1, partial [Stegodyphus mimosarum]